MTSNLISKVEKKKGATVCGSSLLLVLFSLFLLLLMLKNAPFSMECIRKGLTICTSTVIPSIFPFMVLSEILIACPAQTKDCSYLGKHCRKRLALPKSGLTAILLGLLCGFPIGARCAADGYEKGLLTRDEAQRIIAVSGNPSPAFLIGAVGVSLRGNRAFGWVLFLCLSCISLIFAILFAKRRKIDSDLIARASVCVGPSKSWKIISDAVKKAAQGMITVCAYILFFAAIMGCFELVADRLGLSQIIISIFAALLEMSGGTSAALKLQNPLLSATTTALSVGWSGCCIHCQIFSICEANALSMRPYLLIKAIQGLLCALIMMGLCMIFPSLLLTSH